MLRAAPASAPHMQPRANIAIAAWRRRGGASYAIKRQRKNSAAASRVGAKSTSYRSARLGRQQTNRNNGIVEHTIATANRSKLDPLVRWRRTFQNGKSAPTTHSGEIQISPIMTSSRNALESQARLPNGGPGECR